jgi:hypothetical protein
MMEMKEMKEIGEALNETLEDVAPDVHYVIVVWKGDERACIVSNIDNGRLIQTMLEGASEVVARAAPLDYTPGRA